jgi:hypothetical protein
MLSFAVCGIVVGLGLVASLLVPRPSARPELVAAPVPQTAGD